MSNSKAFNKLKIKRDAIIKQVSRFASFLSTYSEEQLEVLNERTQNIEKRESEFNTIQDEIDQLDIEQNDREENEQIRDSFENNYYESLGSAKKLLNINKIKIGQQINTHANFEPTIRLPTINLPHFGGDYGDWSHFKDSFISLVHNNPNLSKVQKFHFLKLSLKGEAAKVIQAYAATDLNYSIVWELLVKRFENKRLTVNNHLRAIFDIPAINRENYQQLRQLSNTLTMNMLSLKALGLPTEHWDAIIVFIVINKLDIVTKKEFESVRLSGELPTFFELTEFIEKKCYVLEIIQAPNTARHSEQNKDSYQRKTNSYAVTESKCFMCDGAHLLVNCNKYLEQSIDNRIAVIKKFRLCFKCLKPGHRVKECRGKGCNSCKKWHHVSLHREDAPVKEEDIVGNQTIATKESIQIDNSKVLTNQVNSFNRQVLLSTAIAKVFDCNKQVHYCRVLLDNGAQSCFITKRMADILQLPKFKVNRIVNGINASESQISYSVNVTINSRFDSYNAKINCLILPQITDSLPEKSFDISGLNIPNNINLADEEFNLTAPIDILVGAQVFWDILGTDRIVLGNGKPTLANTRLGWILTGKIDLPNSSKTNAYCAISDALLKFWEFEECQGTTKVLSIDEKRCEDIFESSVKRDQSGQFIATIPFKRDVTLLGDSRNQALRRFYSLEKRLKNNVQLNNEYRTFMKEYQDLGHMCEIDETQKCTNVTYYLPHHCVIKENSLSTKLRVVFDPSSPSDTCISLNEIQYSGPIVQNELLSTLLRFRKHRYVLNADIEKMYRMIWLDETQRDLQRILWRSDPLETLKCYRLNTVIFGMRSSPYIATRCLKQLAIDSRHKYPVASNCIENDFYVDDLLTGSDSLEGATILKSQIIEILSSAHFNLRKWSSNEPRIIEDLLINSSDTLKVIPCNDNMASKTLGIYWNPSKDSFQYVIREFEETEYITKRTVLSIISQIFDPYGLLTPVLIKGKLIMQHLWKNNANWDEPLSYDARKEWSCFQKSLKVINLVRIPRLMLVNNSIKIEIHGFCDASEKAYGACIYIKSINKGAETLVRLLCSKSKVAPLKNVTLARLELQGALLLARLMNYVASAMQLKNAQLFYWTDSTIVLSWLRAESNRWKTFVANRVAEIQSSTNISAWYHVKSKENPADIISRGVDSETLRNLETWWSGPDFLYKDQNLESLTLDSNRVLLDKLPEKREMSKVYLIIENDFDIIDRYSCFTKLQRITSYCLRFIKNCKNRENKIIGSLTPTEMDESLLRLVNFVQKKSLSNELKALTMNRSVKLKSNLVSLNPYLDENGTIRVGGRIQHSHVPYDAMHQIILPNNKLTDLIASDMHIKQMHCGPQQLLVNLRQKYWPIAGRNLTRKIVHSCIACFKAKPKFGQPQMGELPSLRVSVAPPFQNTGVDHAGYFLIRDKKGRGCKTIKVYVCVFVCLATKAIHLELVSDLSTETFIAALRRFIARRGLPSVIYSDNATTYVGAKNELKEIHDFFEKRENRERLESFMLEKGICWKFIPPRNPNWGGLWEAAVKSMKYHLKRVAGVASLTYEEFNTLLTQIEAVLNSRPLSPLSSDPEDLNPLTPGHFLIGRQITSAPEHDVSGINENRLSRFQRAQQLLRHFWTRWSKEYLSTLQQRKRWMLPQENLVVPGALVIIKEDNAPPSKWHIGRIIDVYPGPDNVIRVASIKTISGIIKRSVTRLAVLPLSDSSEEEVRVPKT